MIIPNTNTLGVPFGQSATPNLADLIAGKFGLFHAKDAPECADLNTARTGYMKVTRTRRTTRSPANWPTETYRRGIHSVAVTVAIDKYRQWEALKSG